MKFYKSDGENEDGIRTFVIALQYVHALFEKGEEILIKWIGMKCCFARLKADLGNNSYIALCVYKGETGLACSEQSRWRLGSAEMRLIHFNS